MPARRGYIGVPNGSTLVFSLASTDPSAANKLTSAAIIKRDGNQVQAIGHAQLFDQQQRLALASGHRYDIEMNVRFLHATSVHGTAFICKPNGDIHSKTAWASRRLPGKRGQGENIRIAVRMA